MGYAIHIGQLSKSGKRILKRKFAQSTHPYLYHGDLMEGHNERHPSYTSRADFINSFPKFDLFKKMMNRLHANDNDIVQLSARDLSIISRTYNLYKTLGYKESYDTENDIEANMVKLRWLYFRVDYNFSYYGKCFYSYS